MDARQIIGIEMTPAEALRRYRENAEMQQYVEMHKALPIADQLELLFYVTMYHSVAIQLLKEMAIDDGVEDRRQ